MSDNLRECVSRLAEFSNGDITKKGLEEFRNFKQCINALAKDDRDAALCVVHDDVRLRVLQFLCSIAKAKNNMARQIENVLSIVMEVKVWQDTLQGNDNLLKWPQGMKIALPEVLPPCVHDNDMIAFSGYTQPKAADSHCEALPSVDGGETCTGNTPFSGYMTPATDSNTLASPCVDDGETCHDTAAFSGYIAPATELTDNKASPNLDEGGAPQLSGPAIADAGSNLPARVSRHQGFLAPGDDLLEESMTLSEAVSKSLLLPGCVGFCFSGSGKNIPVTVSFKKQWNLVECDDEWTSIRLDRRPRSPSPLVYRSVSSRLGHESAPASLTSTRFSPDQPRSPSPSSRRTRSPILSRVPISGSLPSTRTTFPRTCESASTAPTNSKMVKSVPQTQLREVLTNPSHKTAKFVKNVPIAVYPLDEQSLATMPAQFLAEMGALDKATYGDRDAFLKANIGGAMALQVAHGKLDAYPIPPDQYMANYRTVSFGDVLKKNMKTAEALNRIFGDLSSIPGVRGALKMVPTEMVLASDVGFKVEDLLTIEAPWGGEQTKDAGKEAYLVVCDAPYLINLDESGLPVAYIPSGIPSLPELPNEASMLVNAGESHDNMGTVQLVRDDLIEFGLSQRLAEEVMQADRDLGLRIYLLDNSYSMRTADAYMLSPAGNGHFKRTKCTRWEEMCAFALDHARFNLSAGVPCEFVLLNSFEQPHGAPLQKGKDYFRVDKSLGDGTSQLESLKMFLQRHGPRGGTPLAERLHDIFVHAVESVSSAEESKRTNITIAIGGLPSTSDGTPTPADQQSVVEQLRHFGSGNSKCTVDGADNFRLVIRMCTADFFAVEFYNSLHDELDFPLDILGPIANEAYKIAVTRENKWFAYTPLLHHLREAGTLCQIFYPLDKRPLNQDEARRLAEILSGSQEPLKSLSKRAFIAAVDALVQNKLAVYDATAHMPMPLIHTSDLRLAMRVGFRGSFFARLMPCVRS
jgi:hypothetical protein